mmetsp:Transcript_52144/g.153874  ORF Transcript_52144/g.153874 Transcript_52144/m.153874 type:complete len:215 (-) Transcript_52144:110-754(-)
MAGGLAVVRGEHGGEAGGAQEVPCAGPPQAEEEVGGAADRGEAGEEPAARGGRRGEGRRRRRRALGRRCPRASVAVLALALALRTALQPPEHAVLGVHGTDPRAVGVVAEQVRRQVVVPAPLRVSVSPQERLGDARQRLRRRGAEAGLQPQPVGVHVEVQRFPVPLRGPPRYTIAARHRLRGLRARVAGRAAASTARAVATHWTAPEAHALRQA